MREVKTETKSATLQESGPQTARRLISSRAESWLKGCATTTSTRSSSFEGTPNPFRPDHDIALLPSSTNTSIDRLALAALCSPEELFREA